MKQYLATALIGLTFGQWAMGAPQAVYQAPANVSSPPQIDAVEFYNNGNFEIFTLATQNQQDSPAEFINAAPFSTHDTRYYTNATVGTMLNFPGFMFDTITKKTRYWAQNFVNYGTIVGEDYPLGAVIFSPPGSTTNVPVYAESVPIASEVVIHATNVINQGYIGVGQVGLLKVLSRDFTNFNAALAAGSVDTSGGTSFTLNSSGTGFLNGGAGAGFGNLGYNPLDSTGRGQIAGAFGYYINPAYVYDLFWGVTNGGTLDVTSQIALNPPNISTSTIRSSVLGLETLTANVGESLPVNGNAQWATYVDTHTYSGTNIYYNVVFVNTNFTDSNISADVRFGPANVPVGDLGDSTAAGDIVQFSVTTNDIITGDTVTNAFYLLDSGAADTNAAIYLNASTPELIGRPDTFELTTIQPGEWSGGRISNAIYSETNIYETGSTSFTLSTKVPYFASIYAAQVGRDPEVLNGIFPNSVSALTASNVVTSGGGATSVGAGQLVLRDPTNEGGRIEITANQADLTLARIRAEGMVIYDITNLVNGGSGAADWGLANLYIGSTNGSLSLSNVTPSSFQRVRGDVYAYSATFQNIQTNAVTTNVFHYHILVVDQNLRGSFAPTIRKLTLKGLSSIALQDNLRIIGQSQFETTNLTINGAVTLTQSAGDLFSSNIPNLKTIFVNTNGSLTVDNSIDLGYNISKGEVAFNKRKYSITSVTNFGVITASSSYFQTATFENDGEILAQNNGSVVIDANQIGIGLAGLTNTTNYIIADGNLTFSANTVEAVGSTIYAGLGASGSLTLDVPQELTDFVPGTPGTNNVITNFWYVTGGFNLPVKPATGDLFGTEIETVASGFTRATHVWAGVDLGPNASAFSDNEVIGHLTLNVVTNGGELYFTGTGAKNAMYVDYLQFAGALANNYRNGLLIDPSLTIYFADASIDPIKLEAAYSNRLVWVPSFAGPNSTVAVPYENSSNVCLMNAALATSPDISFFGTVANYYNQPYVLNNPSNPSDTYPCPGNETIDRLVAVTRSARNTNLVNISATAGGTVKPNLAKIKLTEGSNYTFTAVASNGWTFGGWTISGISVAETNTAKLTFVLPDTNVMATANFIPNPFTLQKGLYNGLFFQTNDAGVTPDSSGFFTVQVEGSGAFSGRLLMGPGTYSFGAKFPASGTKNITVARPGNSPLTLSLALDMTNASDSITGSVSDGTWTAALYGDQYLPTTHSAYAGRYTMALPWSATNLEGGDGYGIIHVSKSGLLSVAGLLADGTSFSQSVPVSQQGRWPFYTYAAPGKDILLGWVQFTNGAPAATNTSWSKGASKTYYAAGFTNTVNLIASTNRGSFSVTSPALILSGGNLPAAISNLVLLGKNSTYSGTNASKTNTVLTVDAAAGTFHGHFYNSTMGRTEEFGGVLLDHQNSARGFFLGTNESGAVLLKSAAGGQ